MQTSRSARQLIVRSLSNRASCGWIDLGYRRLPCLIGRSGRRALKREGDGATPFGRFRIHELRFRPDRTNRPVSYLPIRKLARHDGWCDEPSDRNYNRPVQHPYPASAERLWRADHLYDVIGVLDYNISPRRRGAGSAIFLHIADPDGRPTEGCIAIGLKDMTHLLSVVDRDTTIHVCA